MGTLWAGEHRLIGSLVSLDLSRHGPLDTCVLDADSVIMGYRLFREGFYALDVGLVMSSPLDKKGTYVRLLLPDGDVVESISVVDPLLILSVISNINDI